MARSVFAGDEERELAETVGEEGREADADKPAKFGNVGVGDEGFAGCEDDGDSENGEDDEGVEEVGPGVDESREALDEGHFTALGAVDTKAETERRLDGADGPSRTLFEVSKIAVGDCAPL